MLFFLLLLLALPFVAAVIALFLLRERSGWPVWVARGAGFQALCAAPGILVQAWWLFLSGRSAYSVDAGEFLLMIPGSWWVLIGGYSVQARFEDTAKELTGHRQATMMDNWHYYYGLVLLQTLLLCLVIAWRLRKGSGFRDPVIVAVGVFSFLNAWLGHTWPWWGS